MTNLRPALFDFQMRLASRSLDPRREALVRGVTGRVLELGIGTGQNLRFYPSAARVAGAEPDLRMLERALPRAASSLCRVQFVAAAGEALPFRDGAFDEVVAALVF